jgi:uncharacterized protein (TIGR03435 family)
MKLAGIVLIGLVSGLAHAQTADGQPSFDAASIKPAPPPTPGRGMMMGMNGGPGSKDPELYRCNNCNLMMLIMQAYDIKPYQLSAPSSMSSERFDITAKVPVGATKEQFRLMLQNMLAERFKLTIHHDQKEMQVYDLVVAKGGPKLKESAEEPPTDDTPVDGLPPPPPGGRGRGPNLDKDGYPVIPKGCNGCIMVVGGGKAHLHSEKQTMKEFAGMVSNQLGKPVVDATGLKGKYDIDVSFDMGGMMMMRGGAPPPSPGGGAGVGPETTVPLGNASDSDMGVPLVGAIQSQLGLKLEPKKGQVEIIMVDRVEKVPTEN